MQNPKRKNLNPNGNVDYEAILNKSREDFNAVTIANKNNSKMLPEYLQMLLEGSGESVQKHTYPFTKPEWLDMEKLRRGQIFAMNNIFSLMVATGMTVLLGFVFKVLLEPLIYSGNSSTPFTAFKRYLQTITYVTSWYSGDLWQAGNVAHQNMKTVRGMHDRITTRLMEMPVDDLKRKITLVGSGKPMWTDLHVELLDDFKSCPPLTTPIAGPKHTHFNQTDLALTQLGFIGFVLVFPKMVGIHSATRDELDSFAHLWRVIGHLLGIEDRFNPCSGDLETVQQRIRDVNDYWCKPLLRYVSQDWVHMARCMTEGLSYIAPGSSFEITTMQMCKVLQIDTPRLIGSLSLKQKLMYNFNSLVLKYLMRIPGVRQLFNWLFLKSLKYGHNLSKTDLKKLEDRVYPYETEMHGFT